MDDGRGKMDDGLSAKRTNTQLTSELITSKQITTSKIVPLSNIFNNEQMTSELMNKTFQHIEQSSSSTLQTFSHSIIQFSLSSSHN